MAQATHEERLGAHFDDLLREYSRLRSAAQQAAEEGDLDLLMDLSDQLEDTCIAIDSHRSCFADLF